MKISFKFLNLIFSKKLVSASLLICALFSFLIGSVLFYSLDIKESFLSFFISDFISRSEQTFLKVFLSSLKANSLFILPLFLSAMSFSGLVLPHLIFSYYSFSVSLAASFLYSTYKFSGILYFFIVLLPDIFIFFLCLFLASYITFEKSYLIIFSKRSIDFKHSLSSFVKNYLFVFLLTIISSLVSGGSSFFFANMFNF